MTSLIIFLLRNDNLLKTDSGFMIVGSLFGDFSFAPTGAAIMPLM